MNRSMFLYVVLSVLVWGAPSIAAEGEDVTRERGFIEAHPDMYWRELGQQSLKMGRSRDALSNFRKSASYADKASQAMVAEMLWNGTGVAQDRALAYAWIDLAAERGYRDLLAVREKYWSALTPDEQIRAVEVGQKVYDEFGDTVAKPRMNRELTRARGQITGSRLGRVGTLSIPKSIAPKVQDAGMDAVNVGGIDGSIYFADKYWKPELYWKWQDAQWNEGGSVHVEVLPIQPSSAPVPQQDSRR